MGVMGVVGSKVEPPNVPTLGIVNSPCTHSSKYHTAGLTVPHARVLRRREAAAGGERAMGGVQARKAHAVRCRRARRLHIQHRPPALVRVGGHLADPTPAPLVEPVLGAAAEAWV
jgi:hypothetical protein